jgi:SnoaL-like domain
MKALVLTAGIFLACQGTAIAQQCLDNMPQGGWLTPGSVTAPDPADRLAIMDVISHFFWARDSKVSTGLNDLFTSGIVYELCTDGGNKQVALRTGPNDVNAYLGDLTTFLNLLVLRTRHVASNTILNVKSANTVEGKTTVLVLLQNAYSELPQLDYTATLKTEFTKGSDGNWRFSRLTVIGDTTVLGATGARGR